MARKMASIQRIWDVQKHPNADALDIVRVMGKICMLMILLCSFTFAQNTTYKDGTECKCDSIHLEYWDNDIIKSESPFINGDLNGWVYNYYWHTGIIYHKDRFSNGNQYESIYYDNNGNMNRHFNLMNWGKEIDGDTSWYKNGQVANISVPEWNAKSYKCDAWRGRKYTQYYENGKIKKQRNDLSNKCIQTEKLYYNDGKLAGIITYKNYELISNKCTDGRFGNENLNCLEKND